ncbi:MAG: GntR family transcriptional regulator [Anaerolineae bacterium]|nr:GntR family transcriptional regulator [Anaerolineae bacterium]
MDRSLKVRVDTRPLYVRTEEALRKLLATYQPGDRLPPEPNLAQQLGVSRSTLREALRSFEERGQIIRRQGVGTFVASASPRIESGLEVLESLDTLTRRMGLRCETQDLNITEQSADEELAALLAVPPGTPLTVVTRTRVAAGTVVAYMYDVLPASLVPAEQLREGFQGSVLDYLLAQGDPALAYAQANILPVQTTEELGQYLDVAPGTMLLLIEEITYTDEGQIINYSRNYFIPEYFQFHVIRRIADQRYSGQE